MPEYKQIIYEKQGVFARVKLNRPRYYNAQSQLLLEEMDDAFQAAVADREIKVIILSGEGDHFSSGHDLGTPDEQADMAKRDYPKSIVGILERMEKIYLDFGLRWRDLPKPTIAMVHGYCIYGGWQIASSMDIIIAAEDTIMLPGFVEYFSLPWDIGHRKAREILFQSRTISAREALELGFVNTVVPKEKLEEEALALAERIAENESFYLRMAKLTINQSQDIQGFRLAVQTALTNFIFMSSATPLRSQEEGKRSLSSVDRALAKLRDQKADSR